MIIRVERGRVALLEGEVLRELKIITREPMEVSAIASALGGSADTGDHVWVPAEAVLRLGADQPAGWRDAARAAFESVEPFGWYDPEVDRVRIHIET